MSLAADDTAAEPFRPTVLVTGAAGSIGSEICAQLATTASQLRGTTLSSVEFEST